MKQAGTILLPLLFVIPLSVLSTEASSSKLSEIRLNSDSNEQSLYQVMAAEMALDRDHPEVALANYIAAAKETQDPAIASRATQIALTVGSLESAIEPALIWANRSPENLEAQITTAALYLRLDKTQDAIPFLEKTQALNPTEAFQFFLILYRQLQDENDNQRVLQALQAIAKKQSKYASAQLALTEIYLLQNKNQEGLQMSDEALKIDPHASIAIQLHCEALLRAKNKAEAKKYIDHAVKDVKNDLALQQYYTQFLYDNDYKKEARVEIEKLIKNPSLTSEELLQFARLSMQAQWFDLSKKILLKSSEQDEHKDLSYYFLARVAEMQEKDKEAIQWFKQVLTGPFHVLSQVRASLLLAENKQYQEAIEVLDRTQPSDVTESKQILLTKIDILNRSKQYQESLNTLDTAITNNPEDLELRYARSLVAEQIGNSKLAEEDLRMILSEQPNHLDALNALGYILTNHSNRYPEAEQLLNQALKLSPNNPSVLDSIGWLYYKMGRYKESLTMLQKAQDIQPDAEIAAHLGEVLWKLNDFEGAKRVWNQALEQHPKHENIINAMKRLMPEKITTSK